MEHGTLGCFRWSKLSYYCCCLFCPFLALFLRSPMITILLRQLKGSPPSDFFTPLWSVGLRWSVESSAARHRTVCHMPYHVLVILFIPVDHAATIRETAARLPIRRYEPVPDIIQYCMFRICPHLRVKSAGPRPSSTGTDQPKIPVQAGKAHLDHTSAPMI